MTFLYLALLRHGRVFLADFSIEPNQKYFPLLGQDLIDRPSLLDLAEVIDDDVYTLRGSLKLRHNIEISLPDCIRYRRETYYDNQDFFEFLWEGPESAVVIRAFVEQRHAYAFLSAVNQSFSKDDSVDDQPPNDPLSIASEDLAAEFGRLKVQTEKADTAEPTDSSHSSAEFGRLEVQTKKADTTDPTDSSHSSAASSDRDRELHDLDSWAFDGLEDFEEEADALAPVVID